MRDHIEYHKNLYANYIDSKLRLLKMTTKYIFIDESLKNLKIENNVQKRYFKHSPTLKSINEPLIPRDLLIKFENTFDQYRISK